jgi:hypothetical protein
MKTIEIVVNPQGETRLETKGFAGASCQEASRFLEMALGETLSDRATAERHQGLEEQAQNLELT